jgi:hypothetical protein
MFTSSSKNGPAIGINDPLIWSLLLCAIAVAIGAFVLLRDSAIPPVGGFGGPDTEMGFPRQAGGFVLQGVREEGAGGDRYLAAVYQRDDSTPVTIEYHPIPPGTDARRWRDARVAAAREGGDSIRGRGRVVQPATSDRKAVTEGRFVLLRGELPADPVTEIWTQEIAGQPCGFVLVAPSADIAAEFRGFFPRTRVEDIGGVEIGVDFDDLPVR